MRSVAGGAGSWNKDRGECMYTEQGPAFSSLAPGGTVPAVSEAQFVHVLHMHPLPATPAPPLTVWARR